MREILNLHIGQAGVQLGEQCWKLYCLEHGIGNDGTGVYEDKKLRDSLISFFTDTGRDRYVPRAIFVDTDPSVIGAMSKKPIGKLFSPSHLISGKEDAADVYSRGYQSDNRQLLKNTLNVLRRVTETLDSLQGFVVSHSIGGGTGSGFTAALLQQLHEFYANKCRLQLMIAPSPDCSEVVVEPYNAVLHVDSTFENVDCTFMVDNQTLFKLCRDRLKIRSPSYDNANAVISQGFSSIMNSVGLDGSLNVDLSEFQTNLVPFGRLHFTMMSYSPFVTSGHRDLSRETSVVEITRDLFQSTNRFLTCDPQKGSYIACGILYRGEVSLCHVQQTLSNIRAQKTLSIVDWSPAAFKLGVNPRKPSVLTDSGFTKVPRSACMLANSTALASVWRKVTRKFNLLYRKKAFVHWYYNEGLEENEFKSAYDNVVDMQKEYADLESSQIEHNASRSDGL